MQSNFSATLGGYRLKVIAYCSGTARLVKIKTMQIHDGRQRTAHRIDNMYLHYFNFDETRKWAIIFIYIFMLGIFVSTGTLRKLYPPIKKAYQLSKYHHRHNGKVRSLQG